MPSAKRFAHLRDALRNHPIVMVSTAATVGVLMGGFVTVQVLAPQQPRTGKALEVAAETKLKADTTGSATSVDVSACDQQTWPNLSKICVEEYRSRNRSARVIPLDKIEVAPTADAPPSTEKQQAAPAPTMTPVVAVQPAEADPAPVTTEFKAPEPARVSPSASQAVRAPLHSAQASNEKPKADKARRKPDTTIKSSAKPDADYDDDAPIASAYADDREDRADRRRPDRSRRIVERWTERDYVVPDADGRGQRRITVIHRNGGGRYESLFGD